MSEEDATLDDFAESKTETEGENVAPPTELVGIPNDWHAVPLDSVAQDEDGAFVDGPFGSNLKADEMLEDGYARVIQLQNIRSSEFVDTNHRYVSKHKFEELERHGAQPGDLAIAKMSEPVARACLLPEIEDQYIVVADCIKLSVDTSNQNCMFVMLALNSRPVWKQAFARSRGSTRKRINLTQLKVVQIPNPPLEEQRKIASVLYNVDQAIQKDKEIGEQTERAKKGLAQKLIHSGIGKNEVKNEWMGEVPSHWTVQEFSAMIELSQNGIYKEEDEYGGKYPIIKMGDIFGGARLNEPISETVHLTDNELEKYGTEEGDLVFARHAQAGWGAGDCTYIPEMEEIAVIESNMVHVRLNDDVEPLFYAQYFNSDIGIKSIKRITTTGNIKSISQGDLLNLKVPVPPKEEQKEIADMLTTLDEQANHADREISSLKSVKRGLMQDLLSGTVRTTDADIDVLPEVAQHG